MRFDRGTIIFCRFFLLSEKETSRGFIARAMDQLRHSEMIIVNGDDDNIMIDPPGKLRETETDSQ